MNRHVTTARKSAETQGRNRNALTPRQGSAAGAGLRVARPESFPAIAAATALRRSELRELLAAADEPRLSLYMPLHAPGADGLKNPIRLKNLLREAQTQLVEYGLRTTDAREMLKPARALATSVPFWRQGEGGLALLLTPSNLRCFRLPSAVGEQVHVGPRFVVRPLLELLNRSDRYWLLALSQNSVRLFRGDANGLAPVEIEGLPANMAAALNLDVPPEGGQLHSATNQPQGKKKEAAVFHGQGGEADTRKEELGEYFHAIEGALRDTLRSESAPLVVACVEYQFALYRQVNTYPHLVERPLAGNVEHLSATELHAQAWPIIEPQRDKARREAAARYSRLPLGKTSSNLTEILPAARAGRVETLFIARDAVIWGTHQAATDAVAVHAPPQPGDEDLVELATAETLTHKGDVYSFSAHEIPGGDAVAAIFRY